MKHEIILGIIFYILPMLVILYTLYIFRFKVYMKSNIIMKKTYPLYEYLIALILMFIPGLNIIAAIGLIICLTEEKNSKTVFIKDHFFTKEY